MYSIFSIFLTAVLTDQQSRVQATKKVFHKLTIITFNTSPSSTAVKPAATWILLHVCMWYYGTETRSGQKDDEDLYFSGY